MHAKECMLLEHQPCRDVISVLSEGQKSISSGVKSWPAGQVLYLVYMCNSASQDVCNVTSISFWWTHLLLLAGNAEQTYAKSFLVSIVYDILIKRLAS